jgi:hypothetical protein
MEFEGLNDNLYAASHENLIIQAKGLVRTKYLYCANVRETSMLLFKMTPFCVRRWG